MRTLVPIALFLAGISCIAAAVLSGEADVALFLVFPVFSGSSGLFVLGTALIVFSFVAGFLMLMMGQVDLANVDLGTRTPHQAEDEGRVRYGGAVFIGPIPIAFGSDRRMALAMLVMGVILAIVALVVITLVLG